MKLAIIISLLVWLLSVSGIIYIAYHFISKYW